MDNQRIIVIGASAGGVEALLRMAPRLSPRLAAPVVVVQHIGKHRSCLPELLSKSGPNQAVFAETGLVPQAGMIYVAPPDQHVLLHGGELVLAYGPKEHHARPAINPLFRSAALERGPRTIGVVLTGMLDDGAAGLHAIKTCGGTTLVQDPLEAPQPSMPSHAIASTQVDYVVRLEAMTEILNNLALPLDKVPLNKPPDWLRIEHAISLGKAGMPELSLVATPSGFTCPDCGGVLFEMREGMPVRFLCHTGHAFSLFSLASLQDNLAEEALWTGIRALQEKEVMLRRQAALQAPEDSAAVEGLAEAEDLAKLIQSMRTLVTSVPTRPAEKD